MKNNLKVLAILMVMLVNSAVNASSKNKMFKGKVFTSEAPASTKLICGSDAARAEMVDVMAQTLTKGTILLDVPMKDAQKQGHDCHLYQTFQITEITEEKI